MADSLGLPDISSLSSLSTSAVATSGLSELLSSAMSLLGIYSKWGVYLSGLLKISVDSILTVSTRAGAQVPTYRTMTGAFASYNKVSQPMVHVVEMAKGGSATDRSIFMAWLEMNRGLTTTFSVVTPEKTYSNVTLTDYHVRRESTNGTVTRIIATATFTEIRNTSGSSLLSMITNALGAGDLSTTVGGFVSTISSSVSSATSSVTSSISSAFSSSS